jgi:hypothetical protein
METPAFQIRIRCHYCSHFRGPGDILHLPGGVVICLRCWEWHGKAMRMLAGEPPPGCQVCGITFARLREMYPDGNIPMYLHPKDGIYQVLCRCCSDEYERERLDLYGDTLHGELKKLKGAK